MLQGFAAINKRLSSGGVLTGNAMTSCVCRNLNDKGSFSAPSG